MSVAPVPAQLQVNCRGEDKGYLTINANGHYSLTVKDDAVVLTADGPADKKSVVIPVLLKITGLNYFSV